MSDVAAASTPSRGMLWTGRVISGVLGAFFVMGGIMKLKGGPELSQGMEKLGLPESLIVPLAILELTCAVIYLVPQTSIIGAILLTGYMGGALCTHWRVGDPFFLHIIFGILIWLGVYLRDRRLWKLIPVWQNET